MAVLQQVDFSDFLINCGYLKPYILLACIKLQQIFCLPSWFTVSIPLIFSGIWLFECLLHHHLKAPEGCTYIMSILRFHGKWVFSRDYRWHCFISNILLYLLRVVRRSRRTSNQALSTRNTNHSEHLSNPYRDEKTWQADNIIITRPPFPYLC